MATLFGIDGGLLNSILSKALATGEATFRTSEPHDELRKSAKFRNCNGDCLWCGMTPLYIGVDAENKCVEFKTFGRDFITSYKVDADGLRVDKGGKIILANKAARLIARAADKQDFYEFSIDKGYVDVISGNTTLTFKAIKDKKLLKDFTAAEQPDINVITMCKSIFKRLVDKTAYIGAGKAIESGLFEMPEFQYVKISLAMHSLTFVGVDCHRLAAAKTFIGANDFECVVPASALQFVARQEFNSVSLAATKENVCFKSDNWRVDVKLNRVKFPEVSEVLTSFNRQASVTVDKTEFLHTLELCAIAALDGRIKIAVCKEEHGFDTVAISAGAKGIKACRLLPGDLNGANAEIKMPLKQLLNAIKPLSEGNITIGLSENGLWVVEDLGGATAIVTPCLEGGKSTFKLLSKVEAMEEPPIVIAPSVVEDMIDITAAPVEETPAVEEKLSQIGTAIGDAIKEKYGKDWTDNHIIVA